MVLMLMARAVGRVASWAPIGRTPVLTATPPPVASRICCSGRCGRTGRCRTLASSSSRKGARCRLRILSACHCCPLDTSCLRLVRRLSNLSSQSAASLHLTLPSTLIPQTLRSAWFSNGFANTPICCPSRAEIQVPRCSRVELLPAATACSCTCSAPLPARSLPPAWRTLHSGAGGGGGGGGGAAAAVAAAAAAAGPVAFSGTPKDVGPRTDKCYRQVLQTSVVEKCSGLSVGTCALRALSSHRRCRRAVAVWDVHAQHQGLRQRLVTRTPPLPCVCSHCPSWA